MWLLDIKEHFYADDPQRGPADVKTALTGVEYFFLGNGSIQAAIQWDTSREGTALGLLVMHPCRFGPKRAALTFDPDVGLQHTVVRLRAGSAVHAPSADAVACHWSDDEGVPVVSAAWSSGAFQVEERFVCPDRTSPVLTRTVAVRNSGTSPADVTVETGPDAARLARDVHVAPGETTRLTLQYRLSEQDARPTVKAEWLDTPPASDGARAYWASLATCEFDSPVLNRLFAAARRGIPAVLGPRGEMDGSIWQYNLEWVRDQAIVSSALLMLGDVELSRTMLARLLTEFVSEAGDTVDSGRSRPLDEAELDQNGQLLLAVKTYVDWTGDVQFVREHWKTITAVAEFPLRDEFRHGDSGLLHNCREYWERHAVFGIKDGMELCYQFYPSMGLSAAARLARLVGERQRAERWDEEAARLKRAMLEDARFGLVENGCFIKRRLVDGTVQEQVQVQPNVGLPDWMPVAGPGPHYLDPDTCTVLPIALEFIDPASELARRTLAEVDRLWNQTWEGGGYSRYNVTSEPDSPGPWPFASVFVARASLEAGQHDRSWNVLNWLASTTGSKAGSWFEFIGPCRQPPAPQVGIIPWTWAELVHFFVHHLLGVRPADDSLLLRPRLLTGISNATAALRVGEHRLELCVRRTDDASRAGFTVNGVHRPYSPAGLRLPRPASGLNVTVDVPA